MKALIITVLALVVTFPVLAGGSHESGSSGPTPDAPTVNSNGYKELKVHGFDVQWKVDGNSLHVIESYPTTGWVGWGIGTTGTMQGSTIIIGYVKDGTLTIEDTFGNRPNFHSSVSSLGGTSKISDTSGSQTDGTTTIEFSLPLNSGDQYHVPIVPGKPYKMLLAHANNGVDNLTSYHGAGNRFIVPIVL